MQHKKIDITQALLSNIEEEAAKEFIDSRQGGKTKFTQRAFNRAVNAAVKCDVLGICTPTEAFDITLEMQWQGVTPEYIRNHLARRERASQEAILTESKTNLNYSKPHLIVNNTRDTSLQEDLNNRSWAN